MYSGVYVKNGNYFKNASDIIDCACDITDLTYDITDLTCDITDRTCDITDILVAITDITYIAVRAHVPLFEYRWRIVPRL